jgi:predicted N-acetyltransferase YhbS
VTGSRGSKAPPGVRAATAADAGAIEAVHRNAFGDQGDEIVGLVRALPGDPTAAPLLSLLAADAGEVVGHVLFSAARVEPDPAGRRASILAPLAVAPAAQGVGVGSALVRAGLAQLDAAGTDLVFVLGDPAYYRRFGFVPAGPLGLTAPHPLVPEYADAWMVRARGGDAGLPGRVRCSDVLEAPRYWIP